MSKIEYVGTDKTTGRATFVLRKSTPAFANALRRGVLEGVPTMAIDEVEFRKNGSVLYDEMIAHRLGLMPLVTDTKSYVVKEECKCEGAGCARCTLTLTLKAKGPCTVYASEIKSKDPKVKPAFPEMPIVTLLKNQEIELEATAVLARGSLHARHAPGLCWYTYHPIVSVDAKKCADAQAAANACVHDILEAKGGKLVVNEKNLLMYSAADDYLQNISTGAVTITDSEDDFVFHIEPFGQLKPAEIVAQACDYLTGKFEELSKKVE